jgi:hypothetical protein
MHLGGHGSLGTNLHTQIYNLKFHPIIKNHNSGNHQVGKTGLHCTNILGFKDGEEGITKGTLKLHLSLCPTILTLIFHQTFLIFCQVLFHHLYLLFHNNNHKKYHNAISPRPTLLSAQPMPNPNNNPTQPLHNVDM